jgi:hypothetical protein
MVKSTHLADVAELADALDSGSSKGNLVEVQVLSSAPFSIQSLKNWFLPPDLTRMVNFCLERCTG